LVPIARLLGVASKIAFYYWIY